MLHGQKESENRQTDIETDRQTKSDKENDRLEEREKENDRLKARERERQTGRVKKDLTVP